MTCFAAARRRSPSGTVAAAPALFVAFGDGSCWRLRSLCLLPAKTALEGQQWQGRLRILGGF